MKFLIMFIVLAADRFLITEGIRAWKEASWLQTGIDKVNSLCAPTKLPQLAIFILSAVPFLLIAFLIQCANKTLVTGFISMLLSIVILWYCTDMPGGDASDVNSKDDGEQYWLATQNLFGPIIWFLLLGLVGVVAYHLFKQYRRYLVAQDSEATALFDAIAEYLDWLPARVTILTFGLAGNLIPVVKALLHVGVFSLRSKALVIECGSAASDLDDQLGEVGVEADLIQRSVLVWLLVVSLITLGPIFL